MKTGWKSTAVHALLYFLCVCLAVLIDYFVIGTRNMYYTPGLSALVAGLVYVHLLATTRRFGAVTAIGVLMSVFFFASGHFVWAFLPNLVCGVLADWLAQQGDYRNDRLNWLSYLLFSLGNLAPIVTMWVAPAAYAAQLVAKGKPQSYVNEVLIPFTLGHVGFLVSFVLVLGTIGFVIGQKVWSRQSR